MVEKYTSQTSDGQAVGHGGVAAAKMRCDAAGAINAGAARDRSDGDGDKEGTMPSKGSSKAKRSTGGKAAKAHAKLQPGSETAQVSPGGWQGPPTKDKR